MRGKVGSEFETKLAIMRQCTSVTVRRTDGLASWHKREMYILHLALKSEATNLEGSHLLHTLLNA